MEMILRVSKYNSLTRETKVCRYFGKFYLAFLTRYCPIQNCNASVRPIKERVEPISSVSFILFYFFEKFHIPFYVGSIIGAALTELNRSDRIRGRFSPK